MPSRAALQDSVLSIIQLFVASVPVEVVPTLLDHGDYEDEGEWGDVCKQEADLQEGYELADGDDEEEHVEEELELIV